MRREPSAERWRRRLHRCPGVLVGRSCHSQCRRVVLTSGRPLALGARGRLRPEKIPQIEFDPKEKSFGTALRRRCSARCSPTTRESVAEPLDGGGGGRRLHLGGLHRGLHLGVQLRGRCVLSSETSLLVDRGHCKVRRFRVDRGRGVRRNLPSRALWREEVIRDQQRLPGVFQDVEGATPRRGLRRARGRRGASSSCHMPLPCAIPPTVRPRRAGRERREQGFGDRPRRARASFVSDENRARGRCSSPRGSSPPRGSARFSPPSRDSARSHECEVP